MNEEGHVAGVATGPAEGVAGGLAGGSEGRAPASAAGPSPAAGEAAPSTAAEATPTAKPKYRYRMPYRNTGMGGLDYAIAVCQTCRRVVRPIRSVRSRTGNHGEDYFEHEHPLGFLVLVRSNSGKRSCYLAGEGITDGAVRAAVETAADDWTWYGEDHVEVERKLAALLKSLPRG
jgi:hypothetical protein